MSHLTNKSHLKSAYVTISIILAAPALLLPIPTLFFNNPMMTEAIFFKWHLSMVILLIASVAMDSMLYSIKNNNQVISATLWLFAASMLSIQHQDDAWLLALLFLAHSFRSGFRLTSKNNVKEWWLNIAWSRDIGTAIAMMTWLKFLPA